MLESLTLLNFESQSNLTLPQGGDVFILKTCQRTLLLGLGKKPLGYNPDNHECLVYNGSSAYNFLLEVLCGLQSKILAEGEIGNQFKEAYRQYLCLPERNSLIMNLLERLFMDAKKIRTQYLKEIGGQSYAGIVRKVLLSQECDGKLLIKGSGALAEDLIKLLRRKFDVYISGRNSESVGRLSELYGVRPLAFGDTELYSEFPVIVNTIGHTKILYPAQFFDLWKSNRPNGHYIDLGSPSVIETPFSQSEGIWRLGDVFEAGELMCQDSLKKVEMAKAAIAEIIDVRKKTFSQNYPYGWEELNLA